MTVISNHPQDKAVRTYKADAEVVTPTAQASTASYADVTGSVIDTLFRSVVSFTIKNTGANAIKWKVLAANDAAFAAAVTAQAEATVASAASDSFAATTPAYRYYKVQIVDDSGGSHGEGTVYGVAK